MKSRTERETLIITGVKELTAANAHAFREAVREVLNDTHQAIEIDLSQTAFIDSAGLGSLVALNNTLRPRNGTIRLTNTTPPVLQILELTRLDRIFQVSPPTTNAPRTM